ncbi:spheroidene monooxygenase [Winogradskyella jejuensis]|uniref:Spheroidene monooxygenase n=2 Tax=Winogradskyella jejuensis TaxID=1089305 RepID=A0A1M5SB62_9FLAO|nr:spheroidene monooxygenase [Winogradskyella jejuensis]
MSFYLYNMSQTTVISFFSYKGFKNKWQALGRMGRPPLLKKDISGLTFWKALGAGSGNGFSIWPDWSTFGLLTVFNSEDEANKFLDSDIIEEYQSSSEKHSHILMHSIKAHGKWSEQEPFNAEVKYNEFQPIAVITRATIKPKLAYKFWRYVPSVSKSMDGHEGLIFSKGIGEWPIFMQATFSFWKKGEHMMAYAYSNKKHADMVKKTRELGWYSEELFSRFHPFEVRGNLIDNIFI